MTQSLPLLARGNEGRDNLHQIRKHDHILELASQPNEIQRVLVHRDLVGERGGVVAAQPRAPVRVDADAEVSHASLKVGTPDNVSNSYVDIVINLCCVGDSHVVLIV